MQRETGYAASLSGGICLEEMPGYRLTEVQTDFGKVPLAQIPRPDKPKIFLLPGFAGYPDPTGEVLKELATDFWPIEFGEPYHSPNRNPSEQHIADSRAFEQIISEHIPLEKNEKGTFVGASFATLTLAELASRNKEKIDHALFITPAGCIENDNLVAMGIRYGRETIRNSARAVKRYGKDALVSPLGTTKKAASDIPASIRRGQTVVRQKIARKILGLALDGVRVTNLYATHDGLFHPTKIKQTLQKELQALVREETGEDNVAFIGNVEELIAEYELPGGHDLGCTGRPREYGNIIKRYSLMK